MLACKYEDSIKLFLQSSNNNEKKVIKMKKKIILFTQSHGQPTTYISIKFTQFDGAIMLKMHVPSGVFPLCTALKMGSLHFIFQPDTFGIYSCH